MFYQLQPGCNQDVQWNVFKVPPPQSMRRQPHLPWEVFWTSHHRSSASIYLWCLSVSHKSALPDLSNKCSGLKQMVKNLCTDVNTKPLAWHHLWRRQISCFVIKRLHRNSSIMGKTIIYLFYHWYIVAIWDCLSTSKALGNTTFQSSKITCFTDMGFHGNIASE